MNIASVEVHEIPRVRIFRGNACIEVGVGSRVRGLWHALLTIIDFFGSRRAIEFGDLFDGLLGKLMDLRTTAACSIDVGAIVYDVDLIAHHD